MPGMYYEDMIPGTVIHHDRGRTITEAENVMFCSMTMNTQPLHLNRDFVSRTEFKEPIVNGMLTMALTVGLTVPDITEGTIIANLSYENVYHPNPVFHGDTIYAETEILERRESRSRPNAGIVKLRHWGRKPDGTLAVEITRTALFLRRTPRQEEPAE